MTSNFNGMQARENSTVSPYTYESLLEEVLNASEIASKYKFKSATFTIDFGNVTDEILSKLESEIKSRDLNILITLDNTNKKTIIVVSW